MAWMRQSGARLVEVGTTNRTRLRDFEEAITAETAALLVVHPSNFRVVGFTESPTLAGLAALAHARGIPLSHDLGGGALVHSERFGLAHEPIQDPRELLSTLGAEACPDALFEVRRDGARPEPLLQHVPEHLHVHAAVEVVRARLEVGLLRVADVAQVIHRVGRALEAAASDFHESEVVTNSTGVAEKLAQRDAVGVFGLGACERLNPTGDDVLGPVDRRLRTIALDHQHVAGGGHAGEHVAGRSRDDDLLPHRHRCGGTALTASIFLGIWSRHVRGIRFFSLLVAEA